MSEIIVDEIELRATKSATINEFLGSMLDLRKIYNGTIIGYCEDEKITIRKI